MTSKLETEILHWRTKTAAYMVFAKARLTEVIEQLCIYQLLCLYLADVFQIPCLRKYPKRYIKLSEKFIGKHSETLQLCRSLENLVVFRNY